MKDTELSKAASYALRHDPQSYGLTLDPQGWVPVDDLIHAIKARHGWDKLQVEDLSRMIAQSSKRRHEMADGRIRALYGHSVPGQIEKPAQTPPDVLYHGTDRQAAQSILREGLSRMSRQYVHLSPDRATAIEVGRRKDREPVLLVIDARRAHEQGVTFYEGNEAVWLAEAVPPVFIRQE